MNKLLKRFFCTVLVVITVFLLSFTAFAVDADYMDKHGEEGKQLWADYLNALQPLKEGKYPDVLNYYNYVCNKALKPRFEDLTHRDSQELIDMTDYDKLLWSTVILNSYYKGASYNSLDDWSTNCNSIKKNFKNHITDEEEYKAINDSYIALMDWCYFYYEYTGGFYNFIEDKDSFDYTNEFYGNTSSKTKDTEDKISSVVSSESSSEKTETISSQVTSIASSRDTSTSDAESKGIWSGVASNLRKNIVTIIIAILFLIALAYIVINKKRENKYGSGE